MTSALDVPGDCRGAGPGNPGMEVRRADAVGKSSRECKGSSEADPSRIKWSQAQMAGRCAVPLDTPTAGEVALGQVVRYPGTCRGPAGQFSGRRPEAHAGM